MYYDDEFYYEPSEFDQQIHDFKQSLLKSVKEEYISEMEKLRKENAELQDVKKRMDEIEKEHRDKLHEFNREKSQLTNKIRKERLNELLSENFAQGWGLSQKPTKADKCEKCDANRRIHYKTPSGKNATESCECDKSIYFYSPKEIECYRFVQSKRDWGGSYQTPTVYFSRESGNDYDEYNKTTNIYGGEEFESVRQYGVVFLRQDDCQKYCDWMNEKEANKWHSNDPAAPKSK